MKKAIVVDSRLCNAVKDKLPWVHQLSEHQGTMH